MRKRRGPMGNMKRSLAVAGMGALVAIGVAMALPARVLAQPALVGSDIPAAIVTFPLVVVEDGPLSGFVPTDTFIQLANVDTLNVHSMQCFYINAAGRCTTTQSECLVNFDCPLVLEGESCTPAWRESNFFIDFTPQQPLGWQAS